MKKQTRCRTCLESPRNVEGNCPSDCGCACHESKPGYREYIRLENGNVIEVTSPPIRSSISLGSQVAALEDRLAEAKDLIGNMLATLTLPSNQATILAGMTKQQWEIFNGLLDKWRARTERLK